jgi:hypothetical protein
VIRVIPTSRDSHLTQNRGCATSGWGPTRNQGGQARGTDIVPTFGWSAGMARTPGYETHLRNRCSPRPSPATAARPSARAVGALGRDGCRTRTGAGT